MLGYGDDVRRTGSGYQGCFELKSCFDETTGRGLVWIRHELSRPGVREYSSLLNGRNMRSNLYLVVGSSVVIG